MDKSHILTAVVAAVSGFVLSLAVSDKKASSEESHAVHNYLQEHQASKDLFDRFNTINGNWPPSRNKLSNLLLDAQVQISKEGK